MARTSGAGSGSGSGSGGGGSTSSCGGGVRAGQMLVVLMFVAAREVGSFIRIVAEIQRALNANMVIRVELPRMPTPTLRMRGSERKAA